MDLLFATCAESASVDSSTNRLSLFNIIEEISAASFPAVVPALAFVFMLSRAAKEGETVDVSIVGDMDGERLFNLPIKVSFQGKTLTRVIATLQGFPVPRPGTLTLSLMRGRRKMGEWPITVRIVGPIAPAAPPPTQAGTTRTEPKKRAARRASRRR